MLKKMQPRLYFPDHELTPEIPPTWSEESDVFHTTERCTRLQSIPRNRREQGKPGVGRRLCFNCEDILRAKRSG